MTAELKGQICEVDPEDVAYRKATFDWISGRIDYTHLIDLYPSYLLHPHERAVRFFKNAADKILGNIGTPQN
jgi:hypothetical protein